MRGRHRYYSFGGSLPHTFSEKFRRFRCPRRLNKADYPRLVCSRAVGAPRSLLMKSQPIKLAEVQYVLLCLGAIFPWESCRLRKKIHWLQICSHQRGKSYTAGHPPPANCRSLPMKTAFFSEWGLGGRNGTESWPMKCEVTEQLGWDL